MKVHHRWWHFEISDMTFVALLYFPEISLTYASIYFVKDEARNWWADCHRKREECKKASWTDRGWIRPKIEKSNIWERTPIAWPAPRGPHRSNAIGPKRFILWFSWSCLEHPSPSDNSYVQVLDKAGATEQGDETTIKEAHDAADHQQRLGEKGT